MYAHKIERRTLHFATSKVPNMYRLCQGALLVPRLHSLQAACGSRGAALCSGGAWSRRPREGSMSSTVTVKLIGPDLPAEFKVNVEQASTVLQVKEAALGQWEAGTGCVARLHTLVLCPRPASPPTDSPSPPRSPPNETFFARLQERTSQLCSSCV